MMRFRDAIGAERLPSWRGFLRALGQRLIEIADRRDVEQSPLIRFRIAKQWEPKRGTVKRFTRRHQETLH